jgi:hypothetical protein
VGVKGDAVHDRGDESGVGDDLAPLIWNGKFEAVAIEAFSSLSVRIWKSSSAPRVSSWT